MQAVVIGGGLSGVAAARFLGKRGWNVTLSDVNPPDSKTREQISGYSIKTTVAPQDLELVRGASLVVASPGLSPKLSVFSSCAALGIPVVSEIDLFRQSFRGRLIGITGTNGKSTTTALIEYMLNRLGEYGIAAGNIGVPAAAVSDQCTPETIVSLELSSYQLEWSHYLLPDVAIIVSLGEDHLARHGTIENYLSAKWRLINHMKQSSVIIISSQAKEFAAQFGFVVPKNAIVVEEATTKSLPLWGLASAHDNVNAECAVHAVRAITGASYDQVADAMRGFPGLPHRCELVATKAPFRFINDSKATNVQSTEAALSAISRPCVLLLGGQGKGESFGSIMNYQEKIKQIIAFGRDASVIGEQLKSHFQLSKFDTLASALDYLFTREENIECDVLFSPGCASFDEFKNFERRGEFFKSRVIAKFGQL